MKLTEAGLAVEQEWLRSRNIRQDQIFLGEYVIMPNHMHMMVFQAEYEIPLLRPLEGLPQTPGYVNQAGPSRRNISSLMRCFKSEATKAVRAIGLSGFKWQRGFNDRIIRSQDELERINRYIAMNPANWPNDAEYPG